MAMSREEAYALLGIPSPDDEQYASFPDEYYASFPNASYPPPTSPIEPLNTDNFFNPNLNASKPFSPARAPSGAPVASQSVQIDANASRGPQGGLPPYPAPLPLPTPPAPQGGPPAAPDSGVQGIDTQSFFKAKPLPGMSSQYALPQSVTTPVIDAQSQLRPSMMQPQQAPAETNLGTFPPPVPTDKPIVEPTSASAPLDITQPPNPAVPPYVTPPGIGVPPASVTPVGQETVNTALDPNQKLLDAYNGPITSVVNAAVMRDLERRRKEGALLSAMVYYGAVGRGERPSDVALQGMLGPSTTMFETEGLKTGAETASKIITTTKEEQALDKNSQLARAVRLAALGDSRFQTIVQRHAQATGITPEESATFISKEVLAGMSPFEVNSFLEMASQGQDYTNKGIQGYKSYAEAENLITLTNKLRIENATAKSKADADWDKNSARSIVGRRLFVEMPFFKNMGITPEMIQDAPYGQLEQFNPEFRKAMDMEVQRLERNRTAFERSQLGGDIAIRPIAMQSKAGEWTIAPGNAELFNNAHTIAAQYDKAEDAYAKLMELYRTRDAGEFAAGMVGNGPLAGEVRPLVEQYRVAAQSILESGPRDQNTAAAASDVLGFITQGTGTRAKALEQSMDALHNFVATKFKPVYHVNPIGAKETPFGKFPNGYLPANPQLYTPFKYVRNSDGRIWRVYQMEDGNLALYSLNKNNQWDKIVVPPERLRKMFTPETPAPAAKPEEPPLYGP